MSINETKDNSRLKQGFKSFVWLAVMFQILVVLLPGVAAADDALFITAVGGALNDYGYSVVQTSDGGYVVTGKSQSYGGSDDDLLLIKFDSSGAEEWTKTVGGTSADVGNSVAQTSDGGYIVTGSTDSYDIASYDLLLVKFNSSGAEEWTKAVGDTSSDHGYSVAQTSDGGYVVTGLTYSYGAGGIDVWLIKFNSSGAEEWTKTVGDTNTDRSNSVVQTSDGGYIVTGDTKSYSAGDSDVLLVKFDSSGAEEWTKTVGGTSADVGYSVVQTSDGGYIVTGNTNSYDLASYDLLLVKFDSSGAEEWTKTVGGASSDIGRSVVQTSDGG
ncbi:MAG: hypothetical protein KAI26_05245, partial [Nanoarchaeota archaeon]|nr:hypothetical protein [Nanoarchaeota archaeon]